MCQTGATHSATLEPAKARSQPRKPRNSAVEHSGLNLASPSTPSLPDYRESALRDTSQGGNSLKTVDSVDREVRSDTRNSDTTSRHSGVTQQPNLSRAERRKLSRTLPKPQNNPSSGNSNQPQRIENKTPATQPIARPPTSQSVPPIAKSIPQQPPRRTTPPPAPLPTAPARPTIEPFSRDQAFVGTNQSGRVKNLSGTTKKQPEQASRTLAERSTVETPIRAIFDGVERDINNARNPGAENVIRRLMKLVWNESNLGDLRNSTVLEDYKSQILSGLNEIFGDDFSKLKIPDFLKA